MISTDLNDIVNISYYKALDFKYDLQKLYDLIFSFCDSNKNIYLYNYNINLAIIENKKYKQLDLDDDFQFILFSQTPKQTAMKLFDIISEKYSKYVALSSYLYNNEQIITIDNNKLIYVNMLLSANTVNIIEPHIYKFNNYKLNILPHEIVLLYMSKKLYHPSIFLDIINSDHPVFFIKFCKILSYINNSNENNIQQLIINKNSIKQKIINSIIELLNEVDNVAFIDNNPLCISYNKFIDLIKQIKIHVAKFLSKNGIEYNNISYTISNTFIYDDFRLKKVTLYVELPNIPRMSIITIFNNIDYEIVPIIKNTKKNNKAHELVIVRTLLFNLISAMIYDKNISKKTKQNYISNIVKLVQNISKINYHKDIYYMGNYRDEKIDKFKLGSNTFRNTLSKT